MTFKRPYSAGLAALAVGLFAATAACAEPTINKGDNAWMLTSTVLVLLMTIPGLALFYGGLVRSKNMLSVLMQVFYTVCIVTILWAIYGYSLAFTGGSDFIGSFSKAFLAGITPDSKASTFSVDANISELVYVCFQMTFAAITPALIVGAFAERMKFSAVALFIPLWSTLVYFPIAHMVWYWAGPDAIADAVKAIAAAGSDAAAKAAAEAKLAEVNADAGWVFKKGAIDFAGQKVAIDRSYAMFKDRPVTFGVRPEAVDVKNGGGSGLAAKVMAVTPLNERTVLLLQTSSGAELLASLPSSSAHIPKSESSVSIAFNPNGTHLFDRETGAALGRDSHI